MPRMSAKVGFLGIFFLIYLIPLTADNSTATACDYRCETLEILSDFDLLEVPESNLRYPETLRNDYLIVPNCRFLDRWLLPVKTNRSATRVQHQIRSQQSANLVSGWATTRGIVSQQIARLNDGFTWTQRWITKSCSWANAMNIKGSNSNLAISKHRSLPTAIVWQSLDESDLEPVRSNDDDFVDDLFNEHADPGLDEYWQYYDACDRWSVEFAAPTGEPVVNEPSENPATNQIVLNLGFQSYSWNSSWQISPEALLEQSSEWVELLEFAFIENLNQSEFVGSDLEINRQSTWAQAAAILDLGQSLKAIQESIAPRITASIRILEDHQMMANAKAKVQFANRLDAIASKLNQLADSIRSSQTAQSVQALKR